VAAAGQPETTGTGSSLLQALESEEWQPGHRGLLFDVAFEGASPLRGLRKGSLKLAVSGHQANEAMLYDLQTDPAERRDLFYEQRAIGAEMLDELEKLLDEGRGAPVPTVAPDQLPDGVMEQLQAIGYF
jgi:hypothetical protein